MFLIMIWMIFDACLQVPYLYLNTCTFCCRSKIKGIIYRWSWICLLMNIKLQAPENLFANSLMKPSRNMVKMWRFYALFFCRLPKRNKCPGNSISRDDTLIFQNQMHDVFLKPFIGGCHVTELGIWLQ
ncbi:hypothetical protein EDC04DRAFT_1424384 [Pisolithus marmoratus]|nr:hypothetical protein EDC04DRAFT_1424384 [Pisolithus marmoratus]